MNLTIEEKKILYVWGCPDYHSTIRRLIFAAGYMTEPKAKAMVAHFRDKLIEAEMDECYTCFFYHLRLEMEEYFNLKNRQHQIEVSTLHDGEDYEDETF